MCCGHDKVGAVRGGSSATPLTEGIALRLGTCRRRPCGAPHAVIQGIRVEQSNSVLTSLVATPGI